MATPFILLFVFIALGGYAVLSYGPVLSDLLLLSAIATLASLILVLRALLIRLRAKPVVPQRWVVVDGSNVMHWRDEAPQLATVHEVVRDLTVRGFSAGVVFDANVGYKLAGRYQDDAELARKLDLPTERVLVVPKGTQADPYLLKTARDLGGQIVTNDRFRDWAEAFPEVRASGFLIRGGYRDGKLWLADKALGQAEDKRAPGL